MAKLFEDIVAAIQADRFVVSWHADERCEVREISAWQLAAGIDDAELVRERPGSKPNASVIVRQQLSDGSEVEVVWSWLAESKRALLVTVCFPD